MEAGMFLFKALSNLSLVFMIVNFVFGFISRVPLWHLLLFIGANLLSFFVYYATKRGLRKVYFAPLITVSLAITLLPLVFLPLNNNVYANIAYVVVNDTFAIYVGWSGIKLKKDYGLMADIFVKGLGVVVIIMLLMLIQGNTNLIGVNYTFYILIFLFSSIYLLRTLRHLQYNNDERELRKFNLSYALFILIGAFILGSAVVRGFLGHLLWRIYDVLVWIFVYLLSWLALPIGYLIKLLADGLHVFGLKGLQTSIEISGTPLENLTQNAAGVAPDFLEKLRGILRVPVKILIVVLLLFSLFKLLRRLNDWGRETEEYSESRESILSLGERTSRFPKISGLFVPRNGGEAIRHYYKQFLHFSLKKEINIEQSDTTLEINKKGERHFDKDVLETMRTIYIQVRYGGETCGEETVRNFRSLLKRLVQGSRAK